MKKYYLGVDVGSTKSHALIADERGQAVGFGKSGPGNPEGVWYDGLIASLHECTSQALEMARIQKNQIYGAGFGISGYDWPGELAPTTEAVKTLGLEAPIEIVNDTIIGLVAGARKGWGVGLVSGTGCNCWGWDENHMTGRVTGMGGWFGEYAGGGDIVHKAIVAVAYEAFKRGPATQLTPAILKLAGARNALELFEGLTLENYHIGPEAAPLVFEIADQGDPVAVDILRWAGTELGEMANCVIRQIRLEHRSFDMVFIGSIFDGGALLIEPLKTTVRSFAPNVQFIRLQVPPVVGGVLIGFQAGRVDITPVRENLFESTLRLLQLDSQRKA
jgi:N-acetylglucosamine kinase-like BadF-type ATPase